MALNPRQVKQAIRDTVRQKAREAVGEVVKKVVPSADDQPRPRPQGEPVYHSSIPWAKEDPSRTLVIMCSSSQFTPQCAEFVEHGLHVAHYDLLAVPGGVQWLALPEILPKHNRVARWVVEFLIKRHRLERAICIAHEGCSAYEERGTLATLAHIAGRKSNFEHQLDHLQEAGRFLIENFGVRAELYYASIVDGAVAFYKIE